MEAVYGETCGAVTAADDTKMNRLTVAGSLSSNTIKLSPETLQKELERAQSWLETHSTDDDDRLGPNVTRSDFRGFRD